MNIPIMTSIRKIYPKETVSLTDRQQSLLDKIKLDGSITTAAAISFTKGTAKTVRNDIARLKILELISVSQVGARYVFSVSI